jgi:A/G-specific adenine glycosylase
MLQQTQVARVVPAYDEFLTRFPDAVACADATVADVVRLWAGLGYNRRAVNLHRCAVSVRDEWNGQLPDSLDALLTLPGVGPYTARAVLAFAFEHDAAVVDTNVARVVARVVGRSLARCEVQAAADAWSPPGQAWAWNQGLMDLGSALCSARTPTCAGCPLASACAWRAAGRCSPDPAVGSAGVSGRQSAFAGSDRQGRGRLVAALRHAAVPRADLAAVMGWPDDRERAERVAATLLTDGLATADITHYFLFGQKPVHTTG